MTTQPTPFTLGEWLVQPQLNRLSRAGGADVQLEPKMMDVLVCLARSRGDVVSREALIDAVWPEVFISESVLTRAIAGLRRALGDDARRPRFIETIAKRGYRLIGPAAPVPVVAAAHQRPGFPGGSYVVGQWVRAEGFYGRAAQLAEVLDGPRNGFWVVGTRRRGKTSFLKQLEHVAISEPARGLVPVFWDLQGVDDLDALAFSLEEALADAEPRLEAAGLSLAEIIDPDVFRMLGTLRRRLNADGRELFLLCDEAEALRTSGRTVGGRHRSATACPAGPRRGANGDLIRSAFVGSRHRIGDLALSRRFSAAALSRPPETGDLVRSDPSTPPRE